MKKCVYCKKWVWFRNVHKSCELGYNLVFARKRLQGEVESISKEEITNAINDTWNISL